jgi:hypothetical protein
MFFLAATAYCTCDSYDPDPYDDIPPVVTVQFNYVVPSRVNICRPQSQNKKQISRYFESTMLDVSSVAAPRLRKAQLDFAFDQTPPKWAVPLRR